MEIICENIKTNNIIEPIQYTGINSYSTNIYKKLTISSGEVTEYDISSCTQYLYINSTKVVVDYKRCIVKQCLTNLNMRK